MLTYDVLRVLFSPPSAAPRTGTGYCVNGRKCFLVLPMTPTQTTLAFISPFMICCFCKGNMPNTTGGVYGYSPVREFSTRSSPCQVFGGKPCGAVCGRQPTPRHTIRLDLHEMSPNYIHLSGRRRRPKHRSATSLLYNGTLSISTQ